ncbi:hypothetical protein GBA52_029172 [Prunus armeniaca]|nr:hypothetical protein GBA52_029172 [Prunus armeniaca]
MGGRNSSLHFRAGLTETACTSGRPLSLTTHARPLHPDLHADKSPLCPLMCAHIPSVGCPQAPTPLPNHP